MSLTKEKRRRKHSPRDWWMQFSKKFPIFPVKPDKTPAVRSWKTEASQDPEVVDMWLTKFGEDTAFAMPTGDASGVWAIDIDVKKGKKGAEFFKAKLSDYPDTVTQTTPSGGYHYLYKYNRPVRNRVDIFGKDSGVDIRGDGGYIVVAMSPGYAFDGKKKLGAMAEVTDDRLYKMIEPADRPLSTKPAVTGTTIVPEDDLRSALFSLKPTDEEFETRDGWQEIMRSVHSGSGGEDWGKDMFIEWSLQHPGPWEKPIEAEIERDWSSYDPNKGNSMGTLYHHIQKRGILIKRGTTVEDTLLVDSDKPKFIMSPKGKISPNPHNAIEYLRAKSLGEEPNPFYSLFVFNELTRNICWFREPIWDKTVKVGDPIADPDITTLRAKVSFLHTANVDFGKDTMRDAITSYAYGHKTHPIRNFLKGLVWDGQERLSSWLIDACGTDDNLYTRAVSRKVLISAIARIMNPGEKVHNMMVLEGNQGCRKSTLVEVMGYHKVKDKDWYSCPSLNIAGLGKGDSSAVTDTFGSWILEVPEMMSISNADEMQVKSFITTSHDKVTLKYDKYATVSPRQYILIGTMNPYGEGRYIKDHTGARRYWPIKVNRSEKNPIDTDAVAAIMDQLYAEAFVAYKKGEPWHICPTTEKEALDMAQKEQSERIVGNSYACDVDSFFSYGAGKKMDRLHTSEICKQIWPMERKITQYMKDTVCEYVKALGWVHKRGVRINSVVKAGYAL